MPGNDNNARARVDRLLEDPTIHYLLLHCPELCDRYPFLRPALQHVERLYFINMETSAISEMIVELNDRIAGLTRVLNTMQASNEE